jgi:putative tryptophan/tyrosine transport system substrate-binding protein
VKEQDSAGRRHGLIRRRDLIPILGGAAVAWRSTAWAQAMPVIGLLNGFSPEERPSLLAAFKQSLGDAGYVEGRSIAIEYRWARAQADRLPALAAELVQSRVDVIVACGGDNVSIAAKAATRSIPIVGIFGGDPIASGLVGSINRPGGNLTGISLNQVSLIGKRVELLHEMIPAAATIALLVDSRQMDREAWQAADVQTAAEKLKLQVRVLKVGSTADLDAAFATLAQERVGALLVSGLPIWQNVSIRSRLVALATQYAIPAGYYERETVEAGGLMSYGTSIPGVYRQLGVYAARVLKGDKPADLPVQQPTTFELVINLKAAKTLGLRVPQPLLIAADEVIE